MTATGLCTPWTVDPLCPGPFPADPADYSDEQTAAIEAASEILWALSGRQFGTCPVTVRPCRRRCDGATRYNAAVTAQTIEPGALAWGLASLALAVGCGCVSDCGCGPISEVDLPGPVASITSVQIDGETLDEADYVLYEDGRLVRYGGQEWPACQDFSRPLGEAGTWGVTYEMGLAVPRAGQRAMTDLAAAILEDCTTGKDGICRLPANVTSIQRNGIDIEMDPTSILDDGYLGIRSVDVFLASFNPGKLSRPTRVVTPETMAARRIQVYPKAGA